MKKASDPGDAHRRTGRPLSFDRDAALQRAMLAFWRHGYETTSVADLTAAMGITAPSLYGTFGDKRRLFLETVRLYVGDPEAMASAIRAAPSAREAARALLTNAAIGYTGETTPRGCLLASATASGSIASVEVQQAIADIRRSIMAHLSARIERDVSAETLSRDIDPAGLAATVMAVIQGMSVLARDGASRSMLLAVVTQTLRGWPV